MPTAPASTCICAMAGILCVLICGRFAILCLSRYACKREILASRRSRSTTGTGVSNSLTCMLFPAHIRDRIDLDHDALQLAAHGCARWFGVWKVRRVDFVVSVKE